MGPLPILITKSDSKAVTFSDGILRSGYMIEDLGLRLEGLRFRVR